MTPASEDGMKVVVCVKQIPDPATPYSLEEGTNWLVRPGEQVLDDTDRYGVEMGLQLAQANEGTVTLISMAGVPQLKAVSGHTRTRKCWSRGCEVA